MTIESFAHGDTIRVKVTFTDEETTVVQDTDDQQASVVIYNAETLQRLVNGGAATRESEGVYYYDWTTTANISATYVAEVSGVFSGKTHLKRAKFKAKFVA